MGFIDDTIRALLEAERQRDLQFLIIGGNAVAALGFPRLTIDLNLLVPEEKRSHWLDVMRELEFSFYHGTTAFAQFIPASKDLAPVDLMFVDSGTWNQLNEEATEIIMAEQKIRIPRIEHLVSLKVYAASSPTREKQVQDWEDVRQIIKICNLDPTEPYFRGFILRYGGEAAMDRIKAFTRDSPKSEDFEPFRM